MSIALLGGLPATASAGPISGSLTQLPRPADCVSVDPASACGTIIEGGTTEARSVRVSPDGENAYSAAQSGAVSTFNRNERSGALSFARCVKDRGSTEVCQTNVSSSAALEGILDGARWVVVSPDGENVYVAASAGDVPFNVDAVTAFARNEDTGALTPLAGKNLCISETLGGAEDDPDTCRQGFGLSGVERMEISPDGTRIYAVSPTDGTLAVLVRDPDTGALTQERRQCFRGTNSSDPNCGRDTNPTTPDNAAVLGLNNVNAVAVSPDSTSVYTVSRQRSTLVAFKRAPIAEGGLTMVECERGTTSQEACPSVPTQGLNAPNAVEVSPDGGDVYTASSSGTGVGTGNTLTEFDRNAADSRVAMQRCARDDASAAEAAPPGGPGGCTRVAQGIVNSNSIAIKPDGTALYVSAAGSDDIAEFRRETDDGDVTQLADEDRCIQDDVPAEDEADTECPENEGQGLAGIFDLNLSPDGLFLYSAATDDSAVAAFSVQVPPRCSDVTQPSSPNNQPVTIPLRCTDANGDPFTLEIVAQPDPSNGTVTVNQANDTATFTPTTGFAGTETFTYRARDSRGQASNVATVRVTIAAPGAPVITIADAATTEGNSGTKELTFTLQLSSPLASATSVDYATANDTAQAPGDYTSESGTATFATNATRTTVTIPVRGDTIREATERFEVNLRNPTNGAVIGNSQAFGTISNDDQSVISINDVTVAESARVATFTVSLSGASDSTVEATYGTQNDTATAPGDYTARSRLRVSFAPGERSKQVTVPIVNDDVTEQTERFNVNLTAPTADVTLGKAKGVGTITDDDLASLRISDASVAEGESGTRAATFTVALSAPVSNAVRVDFATVDGNAVAPGDYTQRTGTVTFAPGETSKTVDVEVKGDSEVEPDESFVVRLANPAGATIADADGAGTIVNDDEQSAPPPTPVLAISDVTVPEGDTGTREAPFTVSLSAPQSSPVTVRFGTADDTATGADYRGATGTLTFAPGETSKPVPVLIVGDTTIEPDERFRLVLADPAGATLGKAQGLATIANDDAAVKRLAPRRIDAKVTPSRDRSLPYRYRVSGKIVLPVGMSRATGCAGRMSIQIKRGRKTISTRRRTLTKTCTYSSRVTFSDKARLPRGGGRLKVTVRFLGNAALLPRTAKSRFVRYGR